MAPGRPKKTQAAPARERAGERTGERFAGLDGTDLALLAALAEDGRLTNTALAARAGVAESTCAYRVRALRASGAIRGIRAELEPAALGRPLQAIVHVRLGSHNREHVHRLYDQLVRIPGVLTVLHVGGDEDFLLHVAVASPQELSDLILEHVTVHSTVRQTHTQLVFETRPGRGPLP